MKLPKKLYPHLHEMYRLCEGDYNTSISAQRYHKSHYNNLEWEKVEIRRAEKFGGKKKIHLYEKNN
jgi:ribosomal protein L44E